MSKTIDLVQRLRRVAGFGGTHLDGLWTEAADEIERLRQYVSELEAFGLAAIGRAIDQIEGWAALHRPDGAELTAADAPGYQRMPYSAGEGVIYPKATADWAPVAYGSVWDAPTGGKIISMPRLQPLRKEWGAIFDDSKAD